MCQTIGIERWANNTIYIWRYQQWNINQLPQFYSLHRQLIRHARLSCRLGQQSEVHAIILTLLIPILMYLDGRQMGVDGYVCHVSHIQLACRHCDPPYKRQLANESICYQGGRMIVLQKNFAQPTSYNNSRINNLAIEFASRPQVFSPFFEKFSLFLKLTSFFWRLNGLNQNLNQNRLSITRIFHLVPSIYNRNAKQTISFLKANNAPLKSYNWKLSNRFSNIFWIDLLMPVGSLNLQDCMSFMQGQLDAQNEINKQNLNFKPRMINGWWEEVDGCWRARRWRVFVIDLMLCSFIWEGVHRHRKNKFTIKNSNHLSQNSPTSLKQIFKVPWPSTLIALLYFLSFSLTNSRVN